MSLWPFIRGQRPFIVQGENFSDRYTLVASITESFGPDDDRDDAVLAIAELALESKVVEAQWSNMTMFLGDDLKTKAIEQLACEIPDLRIGEHSRIHGHTEYMLERGFTEQTDLAVEVIEHLSGLSKRDYYSTKFADDIRLDAVRW